MDGQFVPNLTVGPLVVEAARRVTNLPLDVHLMIHDADALIPDFAEAGSDYLTVHVEACPHLHRTIQLIKEKGVKPGVSLNPATSLALIEPILPEIDLLLVMSVNPGFGGQAFIPSVLEKLKAARRLIDKIAPHVALEVDGGIKIDNARALRAAGADIFVAGSAIFGKKDYARTIAAMRTEASKV
jgi:ribulose-phosphate 3-epimerase